MSALVLPLSGTRWNHLEAAKQEYVLAREHFRDVCRSYDATSPAGVRRFHAALERRQDAFEAYMAAMQDQ